MHQEPPRPNSGWRNRGQAVTRNSARYYRRTLGRHELTAPSQLDTFNETLSSNLSLRQLNRPLQNLPGAVKPPPIIDPARPRLSDARFWVRVADLTSAPE